MEAAKGRSAGEGLAALDIGEERTGSNTGAGISGAHQVERDAHHGGGGSREREPRVVCGANGGIAEGRAEPSGLAGGSKAAGVTGGGEESPECSC